MLIIDFNSFLYLITSGSSGLSQVIIYVS